MGWGHFSAADGFALAMVGLIFLSMGMVAVLVIQIARSGSRRDPGVDALLQEMEDEERAGGKPAGIGSDPTARPDPWERDGDWWKQ